MAAAAREGRRHALGKATVCNLGGTRQYVYAENTKRGVGLGVSGWGAGLLASCEWRVYLQRYVVGSVCSASVGGDQYDTSKNLQKRRGMSETNTRPPIDGRSAFRPWSESAPERILSD